MGDSLNPINLGTGRKAVTVSAGLFYTCAILDDSSLKCWGKNDSGQLGLGHSDDLGDNSGEMGDSLNPIDLGNGKKAVAVSAGYYHTCAILDDSSLKCWGRNREGQLGLGHSDDLGDNSGEMGDSLNSIDLGTGKKAVAVSTGYFHTCALLDDASVKCWGYNRYGQLGLGHSDDLGDNSGEMGNDLDTVALGTGRAALAVNAALNNYTCALLDDTSVKCWGANSRGDLGLGHTITKGDNTGEMGNHLPAIEF